MNVEPLCYDVKSAAAALGVSQWVIRHWLEQKLIPTVVFPSAEDGRKPLNRRLIAAEDLRAFVAKHRQLIEGEQK